MGVSNLEIGVRLGSGFALVLALSMVIGRGSISRLAVVDDIAAEIETNWLVSTRTLGEYTLIINEMRPAEALHVMANFLESVTV